MNLAAENLSVTRGGVQVVSGLTATLEPGAITAIVGPNGAGKSSLLMALCALIEPATGSVTLDGADIADLSAQERARRIGYLPQGADIAWDVAVETLVALGRMPHGDTLTQPVDRAIAALALDHLRTRPVSQLSGGERARALLARVLAGEPQWILADEPLAALDLAHQLALTAHLRRSADQGQGVVIVLHDLAIAMNHADRVLVMKEGALIANGPPAEALTPEIIEKGWGVTARWLGQSGADRPGQLALATKT